MKLLLLFLWLVALTYCCAAQSRDTDPVKTANAINAKKAEHNKIAGKEDAEFLVMSADARMMDMQEGKLATQHGTTAAIRQYGKIMVKDQAMLLSKIRRLAAGKRISLPNAISHDKQSGRDDLIKESGKDFDRKFIKMMRIDHERDVKLFKKAIKSNDKDISLFANTHLPMIQTHLDKINAIKDNTD